MQLLDTTHHIKHVQEHVEIYDSNNRFICSGDTVREVIQTLGELISHEAKIQYAN